MSTDADAENAAGATADADRPTATVPVADADAGTDPADAEFTVELAPKDGEGVTVQLCRAGRPIAREEQDLSFLQSGHTRSVVAGRLGRDSPTPDLDDDDLTEGVKTALAQLDLEIAEADDDETADALRSPREQELRDRTQRVVSHPGEDETTIHVTMDPPAHRPDADQRTLRFTNGVLSNRQPSLFASEHIRAFSAGIRPANDDSPPLTGEEWDGLIRYWLSIAEVNTPTSDVAAEAAIDEFESFLYSPLKVYEDPAALDRRSPKDRNHRGLYVRNYRGNDYDALVLPSATVQAFLADANTQLGLDDLSEAFRDADLMRGTTETYSINGDETRVWVIDPDAVAWSPEENVETWTSSDTDADAQGAQNAEGEQAEQDAAQGDDDAQDAENGGEAGAPGAGALTAGGAHDRTPLDNDPRLGGGGS